MRSWYPFESGVYSVKPGLRQMVRPATSIKDFSRYRREKLAAAEKRTVYLTHDLPASTRDAASLHLARLLAEEHPSAYTFDDAGLRCALTGDVVPIDEATLNTLPFQMTEDVAIMQIAPHGEYLAAGHVCLPSSWRLEEKIGKPFAEMHGPVPGIPLQGAAAMVRSLASRGPYERYAWGVTNLDVLDQEAGVHADVQPHPLLVRVERQTIHPLPGCDAWLFLIHPSNTPVEALTSGQRLHLASALESMTPAQAEYKGLGRTRDAVIAALHANAR